jgi:uncharacterized membrane protein YeiH
LQFSFSTISLAFYTVTGALRALEYGLGFLADVALGVTTGVGGVSCEM